MQTQMQVVGFFMDHYHHSMSKWTSDLTAFYDKRHLLAVTAVGPSKNVTPTAKMAYFAVGHPK